MLTVAKWVAVTLGVVVTLLFLALLVMVTRPAVLAGVSGNYLSRSVGGEDGGATCRKLDDGNWRCSTPSGPGLTINVDWMGCWKVIAPPETDPLSAPAGSDCIQLDDIFTFD